MTQKTSRKINVISTNNSGWHVNQIKIAAEAHGIECELTDFDPSQPLKDQVKRLADVIIYRASSLDTASERTSVLPYLSGKYMINAGIFRAPFTPYKYYQQNVLAGTPYTSEYSIPTYRAHDRQSLEAHLASHALKYPFIAKPNHGAQGKGIKLIRTTANLEAFANSQQLANYVYQNFIKNDGDWRIIVVGGRPLGAVKRTPQTDTYLNNLSQGAIATGETDPEILAEINHIAVKAASAMGLNYCGVDVIRDLKTGKYYILETNTAPQWSVPQEAGHYFQAATGVDVAKQLVDYASDLLDRSTTSTHVLVESYYKRNVTFDPETSFHFASRLWLWAGDSWAKQILDSAQDSYIGTDVASVARTVDNMVAQFNDTGFSPSNAKKFREKYFARYPKLPLYIRLFFKMLFAQNIYNLDIRPQIRKHITDSELIDIYAQLRADPDAIRVLSTHAINFFYLLKFFFRDDARLTEISINPQELLEISRGYAPQVNSGDLTPYQAQKMRIYLLTHAIIGESQFYYRNVKNTVYTNIIKELEQIITSDFAGTSLDNKNEFLVCAAICGQDTYLRDIILSESSRSLSWAGNFLVETDDWGSKTIQHSLTLAEHRSVLFIMANKQFHAK